MTAPHSDAARQAAIEDYQTSGDTIAQVADRHGIARSTFGKWVHAAANETPEPEPLAYIGGWTNDRGVMRPLSPERRTA